LRSIDGFSQILLEDYAEDLDEAGRDYLARVRAASQRMGRLIDDLLDLSRMTRSEMRRERVDLSALVEGFAEELKRAQPERRVEFVVEGGLVVEGDGTLLRVAMENLLRNAWKFTGKQPRARIEFGVTEREDTRAYFVRDDGAGFDEAYAGKLFGAFQRLHGASEFEGTGIGLATVQRIVHRHGGRVWAQGRVGHGATFYFTL
jgi:signal transduction histidine kinase